MDRRMFLRGAGATLWLPLLPSALPRAAWGATPDIPKRALWWFVPNGLVSDYVVPVATGADYDLPMALQPILPIQSRVSVISGLKNLSASTYDAHEVAMPSLLGDKAVTNTYSGQLDAAITVDQFAAQTIGTSTPFGSLQLGTGEPYLSGSGGNIDVLYRTLSWSGPATPLSPLSDPKTVFDRMFAGSDPELTEAEIEQRRELRKSLLDSVLDRTTALSGRLNTEDRTKLDQFTTGVRDLEVRIDQLAGLECPTPTEPSTSPGYVENVATMIDMMVVAFQCDYTRLITFLTGASTSYTVYDFLGHNLDHHTLSHNWAYDNGDANRLQEIYNWQVAQWVTLCTKLAAIPAGDGDLLSNTAVNMVSEFGESNFHLADPMTVLLAGGEAGGIMQGQHRRERNVPHSNLWVSELEFLGVDPVGYGTTSTGAIELSNVV